MKLVSDLLRVLSKILNNFDGILGGPSAFCFCIILFIVVYLFPIKFMNNIFLTWIIYNVLL